MARLQILELPEGPDDERPPFVLVIDQAEDSIGRSLRRHAGVPEEAELTTNVAHLIGARGVLVFAETIEIPANEIPLDADGHPVRLRVEADLSAFNEQLAAAQAAAAEPVTPIPAKVRRDEAWDGHWFGTPGYLDPQRCSQCGIDRRSWEFGRDQRSCETVQADDESGHDFRPVGEKGTLTCLRCAVPRIQWAAGRSSPRCDAGRMATEVK
jgi:hypothetical protein